MKNVYQIVSADGRRKKEILQVAKLYCSVWREWPWLENDWKKEVVAQEIAAVAQRRDAVCFLSKIGEDVAGFSWGYFVTRQQMAKISGGADLSGIFEKKDNVFYISELGVDILHRREKAGAELTEKLMESARRKGASAFILRTDLNAFPARGLYLKLGFKELPVRDKKYQFRTYWLKRAS